MGGPATLPAGFDKWDATPASGAPATLPANFDKWDAPATPSASTRLRENFAEGLGITSDEAAKNFFAHPINTAIGMLQGQGQLALKAKDAYDKGDYKGAVMYGLNYLLPFLGQQTAKAGEQLESGDIAGGVGRTLGAVVPIVAGSPEVLAGVGDAASAAASVAKPAIAKAAGVASDIVDPDITGVLSPRLANVQRSLGKLSDALQESKATHADMSTIDEGAPLPEKPPQELLQANALSKGPPQAPPEAAALKTVPTPVSSPATAAAAETPEAVSPGASESIPRTLSGESALRQVLTGQDNANLLKIARSRGINVTAESQLKPGVADNRLINKIVDDFSDDELDNLRSTFLQNASKHQFGDVGPEAWKTMSLQTYFPDVKIPTAVLKRTAAATATKPAMTPPAGYQPGGPQAAASSADDLTDLLQQSVKQAQNARRSASQ